MFVGDLESAIPASFKYPYRNGAGEDVVADIRISINRLSFSQSVSKDFHAAMSVAHEDPKPISQFLAGRSKEQCEEGEEPLKPILAGWNLFVDKEETQAFEITWENIASRPYDFVAKLAETAFEALFPNPPKAEPSPNGSALQEKSTDALPTSNDDTTSPRPADSGA